VIFLLTILQGKIIILTHLNHNQEPTGQDSIAMIENQGTTLLIVEDNHDLRNGLREILAFEGYNVLVAANGRQALEQMDQTLPDLIISDITMPQMDGYDFFNAVRQRPEGVTIPFIFLTAHGDRNEVMHGKTIGAEDYLVKPMSRSELLTAVQSRIARFRQLQLAQLEQSYEASLTALANGIEVRDSYTRGHVDRVTAYSLAVAAKLGWQGKRLDDLRFGAILHDIGKIHVNENILRKAEPLTQSERDEIKKHPVWGAEMVRDIPYLIPTIPVIRHHHERWDGDGYPDGLVGAVIPMDARIVAVADSLDAITTTRPYHRAWPLEKAYQEIVASSGTQFDPQVVSAFQETWQAYTIHKIAARWRVTPE
jgi:putative two-component system response regulator